MDFIFLVGGIVKKTAVVAFVLIVALVYQSSATHLRAGDITIVRIGCGRTFLIKITAYTNTKNTNVEFGGDRTAILNFGDGSIFEVPIVHNTPRPDLDPDGSVATASYSIEHTFSSDGQYIISYKEPNRNQGVLNMDNSVETEFYIETMINIDPYFGCNSSPVLPVPPIDKGCVGVSWFHNAGAYDVDGDSLSYELVVPNQDRNVTVTNYKSPSNSKFYLNYSKGNEGQTGTPTFSIDPLSGTITWNAPGLVGEYNIAFIVIEWRHVRGVWIKMGYVRRDMQIIIEDCKNKRPDLKIPRDTCVEAGTILKADIIGTDPDLGNKVKIEAFSQIFEFAPAQSPATLSPTPDFRNQPSILNFKWDTRCLHIRDQPYQVVFKISDNGVPRLATFKTWLIKVVGPAPKWQKVELNPIKRRTNLEWKSYLCNKEADKMQVWRRVDSIAFKPDNCETGMPDYLGYTLIAEVPLKDANGNPVTKYTDTNGGRGLAPGAVYCYRLVATFPLPTGGESYVSLEACVGPIVSKAPIITNVSVVKTNSTQGQISVKWIPPFDVDPIQFPPPYTYRVYRGSLNSAPVYEGLNTTFLDTDLNTEERIYSYIITSLFDKTIVMDTSAIASSVRLETLSQNQKIELNWRADVPWSNQIQKYPWHRIYRGPEGSDESSLVLIDSVNAGTNGFKYVDQGQYQNAPLKDGQTYCYRVLTRGGYGNKKINEPLENFSQIICAQPGDTIPPCKPETPLRSALDYKDCTEYLSQPQTCDNNFYRNIIYWTKPEDIACREDIYGYKIYVTSSTDVDYDLLKIPYLKDNIVRDTFFIDTLNTSYARCYKIAAVDRSGNIGELSDAVCVDNCPYYELPNVFTPDGDKHNDKFSAYGSCKTIYDEFSNIVIACNDEEKCARFVTRVIVKIYNRWGKEVYSYEGRDNDEKNTIYINWNGKDSNGIDLATGVYYYSAEVTFESVYPSQRTKIIKGWVHLLR